MFKTVKTKFIFFAIIFIIIGVGGPSTFLILQFQKNFKERSTMMLETSLDAISTSINQAMLENDKDIQKVLENHINKDISDIRIFDLAGTIKYSSNKVEIGTNIKMVPAHKSLNLKEKNILLSNDEKIYSGVIPLVNNHRCQSCHKSGKTIAYLDLDFRLSEAETYFYTGVQHTLFSSIAIIIFLISGLYFIFNSFIDNPLKKVIKALSEVEKGNLKVRQKIEHEDEFGSLNIHFNKMVEQLEKSLKEIDQFHFKQLQRADKLVTLGELAAEMAHEINNPTGVIMARADFIQLETDENPGLKKYSDDLNVIIKQADKIAQITGSVLKYSKKRQQEFENVNLVNIVENSLALFKYSFEKRKISVQNNFENSLNCDKPFIRGNSQQIEQVITNLLNNSIDAMGRDGKIDINIKCTENKYIELSIKDNGPGIEPEIKEQMFLPFFSTKTDKNGTGLGLYIVKNICQHHDAEIICDSKINVGTTFTINFKQV